MADAPAHAAYGRTSRFGRVMVSVVGATLLIGLVAQAALAAPVTYYVDCAGSDSSAGTTQSQAWRTLAKASSAALQPGDSLLFKRGCVWDGTLTLRRSGTAAARIRIGAYGSGDLPRIQNGTDQVAVYGSYLVIEYLHVRADPDSLDASCSNARVGQKRGFRFFSGASNDILQNSLATDLYAGIWLSTGTASNTVRNNVLRNNNMKMEHPDLNDTSGGVGIAVQGDDSLITNNEVSGSYFCSSVYGQDGAAIEIYAGQRNRVVNNLAFEDKTFTELGDSRAKDNVFAYNVFRSSLTKSVFLTTRGPADRYGPVYGTKAYNNSVYLTGSNSWGIYCYAGCSASVLSSRNNILWVDNTAGYSDASFDESNNIYWRTGGSPKVRHAVSTSSLMGNPGWVNPSGGDLHLTSGSPAINSASNATINLGLTTDIAGTTLPQGSAPDRGAYEYVTAPPPTPIPSPTPGPPLTAYAADAFGRTVAAGWGSADAGGAYTLEGTTSNFSVGTGVGSIVTPGAGSTRAALLAGTSAQDVDLRFRARADKLPAGGNLYLYGVVRHNANSAYRPKLIISPSGAVQVHAGVVVNNAESSLGPALTVPGLTYTANSWLWLRAQVVGTNPTTIRVKAWADGQSEPTDWQFTAVNSSAALQTAGATGVRLYVDAGLSNAPLTLGFDDLLIAPPLTAYAADAFGRTVAAGWGSADAGGAYTLEGTTSNFSVGTGVGSIVTPGAGSTRAALLAGTSAQDVDLRFRARADKLPAGGNLYLYGVVRHNANSAYRPKLIISPSGAVQVHAGVVVNNAESSLGPALTVPGLTYTANSWLWLRAQVVGTNPTTIRVKAWADGQSEPTDWQFTAVNSSAALQTAGATGVRLYVDAGLSNAPLTLGFDDLLIAPP